MYNDLEQWPIPNYNDDHCQQNEKEQCVKHRIERIYTVCIRVVLCLSVLSANTSCFSNIQASYVFVEALICMIG